MTPNNRPDPSEDERVVVSRVQNIILDILWTRGPTSDPQIADHYNNRVADGTAPRQSKSGLRTRRKELVDKGLVEPSSMKVLLSTGRTARLWQRVPGKQGVRK